MDGHDDTIDVALLIDEAMKKHPAGPGPFPEARPFNAEMLHANIKVFTGVHLKLRQHRLVAGRDVTRREHPGNLAADIFGTSTALGAEIEKTFKYTMQCIAELSARIKELESRPTMKYCGIFDQKDTYQPGEFVTYRGGIWHCWNPTNAIPGTNDDWQLAVKSGRQGRNVGVDK